MEIKLKVMIKRGEHWDGISCHSAVLFRKKRANPRRVEAEQLTKSRATANTSFVG